MATRATGTSIRGPGILTHIEWKSANTAQKKELTEKKLIFGKPTQSSRGLHFFTLEPVFRFSLICFKSIFIFLVDLSLLKYFYCCHNCQTTDVIFTS